MLEKIGFFIEKKPWIVVITILTITIGFSLLIPSLEMETTAEDFYPDSEIVNANLQIIDDFGSIGEIIMILVEKENSANVITPEALKEEYRIIKDIEKVEDINLTVSLVGFIDILCQIEYGNSIMNCTDDQIENAYNDLISEIQNNEVSMIEQDDYNEKIDYNPYPRLTEGKSIDSLDIKNYFINTTNETFIFSIEVYNLSEFQNEISTPHRKVNTWEWYIKFKNLIIPDEKLDIEYHIAAHVEPKYPIWEIGTGLIKNIKNLITNIRKGQLIDTYQTDTYLWVKTIDQDFSFPIILETGKISFNIEENRIDIEINKDELSTFGISPRFNNIELPSKIGNTNAGVRIYQNPIFNQPWSRITINLTYIQNFIERIQNRPLTKSISNKLLNQFADFSWEDFNELFDMLENNDFEKESISLKDIENGWNNFDLAPNEGISNINFLYKPFFLEQLKSTSLIILSEDYQKVSGPTATLIIVQLNKAKYNMDEIRETSEKIVEILKDSDKRETHVSLKATGNAIISNELNQITEEANLIIIPAIFIVICLILLFMFKRLSYVILPLVSLSISMIWIFGTMVLLGISFTTMTVALVPLLMGLGVDYSVHLFHNYRTELKKGKTPGEAITASIKDIGMAMFLATLTTVIAFLSFLTASVPPLRDFGFLCAIGIIYTFITAITIQASFRYILDRNKKNFNLNNKTNKITLEKIMEKISQFVLKRRIYILLFSVFFTLIMVSGAIQVETTFDMNDFLPEGNESMKLWMDIGEIFPYSSETQEYILIEGNVATIDTLVGIDKTYKNIEDDIYVTKDPFGNPKVTSILTLIRKAIKENTTIRNDFNINANGIPKSNMDVIKIFDYLFNDDIYKIEAQSILHYNGEIYDSTIIRIYTSIIYSEENNIDTNKQMETLYTDLNQDITNYGYTDSIVTGYYSSLFTVLKSMTDSQIISTLISIILATLVLMIVFKNPLLGLISILPVTICLIWIIGTIFYMGYSFNIMTIMVTSLTIGIGIDYSIHATQRFRLTADKSGSVEKAINATISHTGSALFIAAITTAAGFGILILAPMPPEQQFGIITSMTIIYSYITSIIVLPPILRKWGIWRKTKNGYIISQKKFKK
jgi:hydrophobe/amphiphile efflux-3 (HAE3) family protein